MRLKPTKKILIKDPDAAFLPFWDHVDECRKMLIGISLIAFCGTLLMFSFHQHLFHLFLAPLKQSIPVERTILVRERLTCASATSSQTISLPPGALVLGQQRLSSSSSSHLILQPGESVEIEFPQKNFYIFNPLEGFASACKLSFWSGVILTSPFWLFLVLRFLLPALREKEKRCLVAFFSLSALFISGGIFFACRLTVPLVTHFFQKFNAQIGENLWSLSQTLDLTLGLVLAHALVFELFVGLIFCIHFGLVRASHLLQARKAMIVLILLTSAFLTPPDVLSQVLLAFPMYLLYETSILYAKTRAVKELKPKIFNEN